MTQTVFSVRQVTDGFDVKNIGEGWYDEPGIEFDKVPRFEFVTSSHSGIEMYGLFLGKEVEISRMGRKSFPGIIEEVTPTDGGGGNLRIKVSGVHKGYHVLKGRPLSNYDFDEDGNPWTTRDAVTINPWRPFIFRKSNGPLDVYGLTAGIEGFPVSAGIPSIVGSQLLFQHDFQDNTILLPSSIGGGPIVAPGTTFLDDDTANNSDLAITGNSALLSESISDEPKYDTGYSFDHGFTSSDRVRLTSTSGYLQSAAGGANAAAILWAGKIDATTTVPSVLLCRFSSSGSGHDYMLRVYDAPFPFFGSFVLEYSHTNQVGATYGTSAILSKSGFLNKTIAIAAYRDGAVVQLLVNGSVASSANYADDPDNRPVEIYIGEFSVGGHPNQLQNLVGKVYESRFIVYATTPSASDLEEVRRWSDPADSAHTRAQIYGGSVETARYYFTSSESMTSPPKAMLVYRDGQGGDTRPSLQRPRNGIVYEESEPVETIPILNGDWNITQMQPLDSASIILYGTKYALDEDLVVEVCRDALNQDGTANTSRTYVTATLVGQEDDYRGSGLRKWTYLVGFSGSEATKNALAIRLTNPAGSSIGTTKIHFLSVSASTVDLTPQYPVALGSIQQYFNPAQFTSPSDANAVLGELDTDFYGLRPIDALEKLRQLTVSREDVNPSPHWDLWLDSDLVLRFSERRGVDRTKEFSFREENVTEIEHRYLGDQLAYQTVAYGPGSDNAQTRIVSKFPTLYDADRDPAGATRLYGDLPTVRDFVDQSEKSAVALQNKAEAFHKLHRDPIESVRVKILSATIPEFEVGDTIHLFNPRSRTDENMRVVGLRRKWGARIREELEVELGEPIDSMFDSIHDNSESVEFRATRNTPQNATIGISGSGVPFDSTHYGFYQFSVENPSMIDRVLLRMVTLPWQASARATKSSAVVVNRVVLTRVASSQFTSGESIPYQNAMSGDVSSGIVVRVTALSLQGPVVRIRIAHRIIGDANLGTVVDDRYFNGGESFCYGYASIPLDMTGREVVVTITNTSGASTSISTTIAIDAISPHSHGQDYGINQFNGDSGGDGGDNQAVYGSGIKFAVSPTVSPQGLPTDFDGQRYQSVFGDEAASVDMDFDITGFLATGENGVVLEKQCIFFLSSPSANNTKGLTVVSVVPVFKYREVTGE